MPIITPLNKKFSTKNFAHISEKIVVTKYEKNNGLVFSRVLNPIVSGSTEYITI